MSRRSTPPTIHDVTTIYLDHAATSPLRREALDAMLPVLAESWGNPSSPHAVGRRARAALDEAREQIASRLNADPRELVFTSGGTEAINLAVKGAAWAGKSTGNRIITTAVEHHSVLNSCSYLEKFGFEVVILPVDRYGRVEPDQLTAALNEKTILVSLQLANNEVGTLQPIAELIRRARAQRGALIHVDAVQAASSLDIDVRQLDADLADHGRAQVRRPARRGPPVAAAWHGDPAADAWRHPGALPARRHRGRRRGGRHGGGLRACLPGACGNRRASSPAARPAARRH